MVDFEKEIARLLTGNTIYVLVKLIGVHKGNMLKEYVKSFGSVQEALYYIENTELRNANKENLEYGLEIIEDTVNLDTGGVTSLEIDINRLQRENELLKEELKKYKED